MMEMIEQEEIADKNFDNLILMQYEKKQQTR